MSNNSLYKIRSVKYNFLMSIILKVSLFVFPLITFPYVSRVLGADGNGKIAFATSIISYFTMFATLGIPTYGIRACAHVRDNKEALSKTVQELLIICISGTTVSYCVLLLLINIIPKFSVEKDLILVMSVSLILSSIGIEWFYQGIEQYGYITKRNIAFKIIAICLMFAFVRTDSDYVIYGGICVVGTVGSNILNIIRARKYISFKPINGKHYEIKKHIIPSLNFFMLTVASTIYSNLDTLMVGFLKNDFQVGYYNAGVKVRSMLLGLVTALCTVLLPRASYYIKNEKYNEFNQIINSSINVILYISVPLTTFFIIESRDTILFLAGSGYEDAIAPMIIIMPTLIIAGLNNLTGIQVLGALSLEKYTVISTTSAAILDLVLNAFLIPKYGAAGAAFSTVLAEILAMIIQIRCIQRRSPSSVRLQFDFRNTIKIILSSSICVVIILLIRNALRINHHFILLIMTAIVFFTSYMLILILLREKSTTKYVLPIIRKVLRYDL